MIGPTISIEEMIVAEVLMSSSPTIKIWHEHILSDDPNCIGSSIFQVPPYLCFVDACIALLHFQYMSVVRPIYL
jgi:hypothetical protein